MFRKIRERVTLHGILIRNFSYLSTIQAVNLFVTLATLPFLFRVLGKEVFGLVVFAQAVVSYLVVLVNFGFNISGTREISVHRDNPQRLNEIYSSIFILKALLFFLSAAILVGLLFVIPVASSHKLLFVLSLATCFYEFIFPSWFFQGIEKMGYSAAITVTTKLTFFVLIFVFVRGPEDYLMVPLFNGIGSVLAGIGSLYLAHVKEKIRLIWQPLENLKHQFRESLALFISNVSIQVYANANKVVIGAFLGMGQVAIYEVIEKVVLAFKLPPALLNQTLFPKISKERDRRFTLRILWYLVVALIVLYLLLFIASPLLVRLLGGPEMYGTAHYLRLLALTVPLSGLNSYIGIQLLVAFGHKRAYTGVLVYSVIVYMVVCCMLYVGGWMTLTGVILATVGTEAFVLGMMMMKSGRVTREV